MFLAALHYWWPKMTGRMYNERFARWACLLLFLGINATFFPQFVMGTHGMPRRYATYLPEYTPYHHLSSAGALLQATAFLLVAGCLVHSLFRGRKAPKNPWGGPTLEWTTTSPPPVENFDAQPMAEGVYDHRALEWNEKIGGFDQRRPASQEEHAAR